MPFLIQGFSRDFFRKIPIHTYNVLVDNGIHAPVSILDQLDCSVHGRKCMDILAGSFCPFAARHLQIDVLDSTSRERDLIVTVFLGI